MKLCFIANPNSTHTRRWIAWMKCRGHSITLIADTPLVEPWVDIPIYNFPARVNLPVIRYFFWEIWVRQIVRDWKPDVLHAHRVSSAGWLGAYSRFHPLVITPWGSDLYLHPKRSRTASLLARFVMKSADLVTADSQDLCQKAINYGARAESTHVIQWGVDLTLFKPAENRVHLRGMSGLSDRPVVLSPRGLNQVYNIDTIIRSIPLVKQAFPGVVYLLRMYNEDLEYKKQVENLIAELNLQQSIRWVGKIEPWESIVDTYNLADLAVSVPSSDSTAVSLLEAMACGLPVIASDLPSTREWIVDSVNGALVPVRDHHHLAEATIHLLGDPRQRANFAEKNRILVQEKANHQTEMEKMEQLYFGLMSSTQPQ